MPDEKEHGTNGASKHTNGAPSLPPSADGGVLDPLDEEDIANAIASVEGAVPLAPLDPPPPRVAELCAACMRFVASKYKVALDGTPDTLSLLDQYVREARESAALRPESIELVAPAVGAYLGEVMRQQFRGEWWADGDFDSWRLYFSNVYLAFNPLGMGREAISMQEEPGWNAHLVLDPGEREEIEARLAAMPEIDEDEYYLPTTRIEVVQAVVETLRARAEASGVGDVEFGREDYT